MINLQNFNIKIIDTYNHLVENIKLFTEINGDEITVMGLPIINIKNYIGNIK